MREPTIRRPILVLTRGRIVLVAAMAVLLAVGGFLLGRFWPTAGQPGPPEPEAPPAPAKVRPVVVVEAVYPGANAHVVAASVAAPIEQQVNGVEDMLYMSSRSADDGSYRLMIYFPDRVNPDMAQVLVQNRVSLALPVLPDVVKERGVSVKKTSPDVLLFVVLSSPDDRRDPLDLSNYARIQIQDELARLPGVAEVALLGGREYGLTVRLDADKLAARDLTAADVASALKLAAQDAQGRFIQPPEGDGLAVRIGAGRLVEPNQFGHIILKTGADGRVVYLRDVARVELGASGPPSFARLNGKPVVALRLQPLPGARPREVSDRAREALDRLRANLPEGFSLDLAFDFAPNLETPADPAAPEHLLLEVQLPDAASADRTTAVLKRCEAILKNIEGVGRLLALSENPFSRSRACSCILVRLAAADGKRADREQIKQTIRTRLRREVQDAAVRLRDLSGPGRMPEGGARVRLAVGDAGDRGFVALSETADKLAQRMEQSPELSDVGVDPAARAIPQLFVEIDRDKARALGVSMDEAFAALQVHLGSYYVNDFNRFGRTWQVTIQADERFRARAEDLLKLEVRGAKGERVRLGAFASVHDVAGPRAIDRLNLYPSVEIAADLAPGASPAEACRRCEALAKEVLPKGSLFTWLPDARGPR
jgi:multidrug efflux pump subunit AcrB